jgi:hypothetical protein
LGGATQKAKSGSDDDKLKVKEKLNFLEYHLNSEYKHKMNHVGTIKPRM